MCRSIRHSDLWLSYCILLFSCAGGELFHECVVEESFSELNVIQLIVQILEGLCFLHENNIVHLDLKVGTYYIYTMLSTVLSAMLSNCCTI